MRKPFLPQVHNKKKPERNKSKKILLEKKLLKIRQINILH